MQLVDFPFCCTAAVLCGFDQCKPGSPRPTKESLQKRFKEILEEEEVREEYDEEHYEYGDEVAHEGKGIIVATTTTKQTEANEFLKEEGFLCVGPYAKDKHPESGLYLWWYVIKGMYGTEG